MNSGQDSSSDSSSDSNSYSDSDTDLDTLSDTNTEPIAGRDLDISSYEESDAEPDSEAGEILGDISRFRKEGPAKPKHTPQTTQLWKTESGFWRK